MINFSKEIIPNYTWNLNEFSYNKENKIFYAKLNTLEDSKNRKHLGDMIFLNINSKELVTYVIMEVGNQ